MIVWLVAAAVSLTAAAQIVFGRLGAFFSGELGLPMIGLVLIGLVFGIVFASMVVAAQGL